MEYVLSNIFSLLEMTFFWTFLSAFLPCRRSKSAFFAAILLAGVGISFICYFSFFEPVKAVISLAVNVGFSLWLFCGPWYWHILLVLVSYIMASVLDIGFMYATAWLMGISLDELVWKKVLYVVVCIASRLTAILIARIIVQLKVPGTLQGRQLRWVLLTILFPLVSLAMLLFMFVLAKNQPDLSLGVALFCGLLAVANIAILYIIANMKKAACQEQRNALVHQQVALQTESFTALEKNYHAQRKLSHEHKNQLQVIQGLLADGKVQEAQNYVNHLCQAPSPHIFTVHTNHPIIDVILNQKYTVARESDIDMHISVNDLSGVTLQTESLIILLTNLLDNTIEACRKLDTNRSIQCKIICEDVLFLSVRNTSLPVEIKNGTIATTKTPREDHGFGLEQISQVLKSLHAEFSFQYLNGWFEFVAEIP